MELKRQVDDVFSRFPVLMYILIFILFIPKINLISLGTYQGAGIRIDDIIILLIAPVFLYMICKKGTLSQVEFYFYIFFFYTLIVHFLNLPYSRGNILYPLRMLEYWLFFYFGRVFIEQDFFIKVIAAFVIYSGLLIIAQDLHLIGGYSDGVYKNILSKPTGSTNGSYEISMVLTIISPIFFLAKNKITIYFYVLFIAFAILLTESRTALALQSLTILFWVLFLNKYGLVKKLVLFFLIPAFLITFVFLNLEFFDRFLTLFTSETYYALEKIYYMAPTQASGDSGTQFFDQQVLLKTGAIKHSLLETVSSSADLSAMIRFNKWIWALNSFMAQGYFYVFFGIGGGVLGNALDGGIIRILIEYGVVGLFLFLLFLSKLIKKIASLEFLVIGTFLLSNLFIDYYLSYKVTSVFFLICGFLYSRQKNIYVL